MSRCQFTPTASRDIERIIDYVADQSGFDAAEQLLSRNDKCRTLAKFPNMGRNRDELEPLLRSFPVEGYLIFYRPIQSGVEIIRVVSGYQDLEVLFSDEDND